MSITVVGLSLTVTVHFGGFCCFFLTEICTVVGHAPGRLCSLWRFPGCSWLVSSCPAAYRRPMDLPRGGPCSYLEQSPTRVLRSSSFRLQSTARWCTTKSPRACVDCEHLHQRIQIRISPGDCGLRIWSLSTSPFRRK
jgi:hypothetical protein